MTVKEDKKKWNIPWKKLGLLLFVFGLFALLIFIVTHSIESRKASKVEREVAYDKAYDKKLNDTVSKKWDIACKNEIINKDNYKVVQVSETYRIFVGDDNKKLDGTYKLSQCSVIYNITKEIK